MKTKTKTIDSYTLTLWIGGDFQEVRRHCLSWANHNEICITVSPTEFCYVGGNEFGARIGFQAYPRFPKSKEDIWKKKPMHWRNICLNLKT